ncbi:hypothetical protein H4219_006100 [Mycoemilia scoparia]|uniref:Uncharacterized protein n=1 Tax=Mycoemilia scoparia TaxID=417184 RepID=A0A9W8DMZ4_9FUNG|nr:hypothetical protein H4219_006100 [Mycoemilia scoparia]
MSTLELGSLPTDEGYVNVLHARIRHVTAAIEAISYLNIPLCLIIMIIVALQARRYDMIDKVSLRLSVTIAAGDLIYSLVQIIVNQESYTNKMSEMGLRTIYFFHLMGFNMNIFATTCIAFHLHLNTLLSRAALARKLSPYYEVFTVFMSIIIAHPVFYIMDTFTKIPVFNVIIIRDKSIGETRMIVWLMYGWCTVALLYCLIVCLIVVVRIFLLWKQTDRNNQFAANGGMRVESSYHPGSEHNPNTNSHNSNNNGGGRSNNRVLSQNINNGMTQTSTSSSTPFQHQKSHLHDHEEDGRQNSIEKSRVTTTTTTSSFLRGENSRRFNRHRREFSFAIFRIALYCTVPLITTMWLPAYISTVNPSILLANITIILPGLATILNFLIFIINPQLDYMWAEIWRWFRIDVLKKSKRISASASAAVLNGFSIRKRGGGCNSERLDGGGGGRSSYWKQMIGDGETTESRKEINVAKNGCVVSSSGKHERISFSGISGVDSDGCCSSSSNISNIIGTGGRSGGGNIESLDRHMAFTNNHHHYNSSYYSHGRDAAGY